MDLTHKDQRGRLDRDAIEGGGGERDFVPAQRVQREKNGYLWGSQCPQPLITKLCLGTTPSCLVHGGFGIEGI